MKRRIKWPVITMILLVVSALLHVATGLLEAAAIQAAQKPVEDQKPVLSQKAREEILFLERDIFRETANLKLAQEQCQQYQVQSSIRIQRMQEQLEKKKQEALKAAGLDEKEWTIDDNSLAVTKRKNDEPSNQKK